MGLGGRVKEGGQGREREGILRYREEGEGELLSKEGERLQRESKESCTEEEEEEVDMEERAT